VLLDRDDGVTTTFNYCEDNIKKMFSHKGEMFSCDVLFVFPSCFLTSGSSNPCNVWETLRKDYEEVGIETAEGEGEEEGYGDEF